MDAIVWTELLLVTVWAGPHEHEQPVLRVGQTVEGEITDDDGVVHTDTLDTRNTTAPTVGQTWAIEVEDSGTYTIELRFYVFDAYLVLRDSDGNLLAEDDDALPDVHSRIVAELAAGVPFEVRACAVDGGRGAYSLSLETGEPDELTLQERRSATLAEGKRRMAAVEARYGAESEELAQALNNLAHLLNAQGDSAGARPLYERTLAIREKVLGPEHPDVALSLNNLALLLFDSGEPESAWAAPSRCSASGPQRRSRS